MTVLAARALVPGGRGAAPLDFSLDAGAICCILGPPGRGKEDWLRTLAAVDRPAAGELELAGQAVRGIDDARWLALRRRVAYIGASPALLSVLTAEANVMLAAQYHRTGEADTIRAKAQALLVRLGWAGALDALPAYLDERQRLLLALARCLILEPRILFLHEPFRQIDPGAWRQFGAMLAGLVRDGGPALVVVTHNLEFARHHADRVLFAGQAGMTEYRGWDAFAAANGEVREYLAAGA